MYHSTLFVSSVFDNLILSLAKVKL